MAISFSLSSHAILVSADWFAHRRKGHVGWDGFLALGHPRGPCISGSATTASACALVKHKLQTAVEIHNKCLQKLLVAESDQATDECIFCEHHQSQEHINETGNCRLPVIGSALMGNGQGSSGGGRRPVRIRSAAFDSTQQRQTGLPSTSCQTRPHLEVPRYRPEARHVTAEHPAVMRAEANDIVPRR
ncbi:hypothetical protein B296_00026076 [Ensete ventricosum]|uniref:Uncharacterized protein n=1 Tax=Ensete ventricosum TaxID=4639 RepID=A0A427AQA3_ENSVE|nr:hypothetical protein B296_00026076 [Ensete ventricosum]